MHHVLQQRVLVVGAAAAAAALALLAWLPVHDDAAAPAARSAPASFRPRAVVQLAAAAADKPRLQEPPTAAPAAGPLPAVPVTVTATPTLAVGDMGELVVTLGAGAAVGTVSFTAQFDANVLQVRAGSEGDWAANSRSVGRFVAAIADTEDRVQVSSTLPARRLASSGGSVATLQFQAVAPGSTSVVVSDVAVTDPAGHTLRVALSASTLQVLADSAPPVRR